MDGQDWTEVVVRKKLSFPPKPISQGITTLQKFDSDDIVKAKSFSSESRQKIVEYRIAHKLGQKDFDNLCSFPKNTIQLLESNKKTPTLRELQVLNRIMKTGLKLE